MTNEVIYRDEKGKDYSSGKISLAIQIANTLVELEDATWNSLDSMAKIALSNKVNSLLKRYRGLVKDE